MNAVTIEVNGERRTVEVRADTPLLEVLRDGLGLTGSKEGCGIGVCGACTVLLDGRMVSSCIQLAVLADGGRVTTIEGLATAAGLDPVQQAFVACGGLQCGACTPGQVMAARALLNETPHPSRAEIVRWMSGNLCRCTGYEQIVRSVERAAEQAAR
jgi:carbon-monoxide dehydrogenase small subunit